MKIELLKGAGLLSSKGVRSKPNSVHLTVVQSQSAIFAVRSTVMICYVNGTSDKHVEGWGLIWLELSNIDLTEKSINLV